ncbi:hypothetical protein PENSPDRAFT_695671 [Peniophora sp. CONT]|nr:hypothetical protein PENSPDRAFT_695671 [Peniophora sp. CONT]
MNSVINSLSSMPSLEVFKWCMGQNTIELTDSPIRLPDTMFLPATTQPAALSSLRILHVECPMACIATLMSRILIPPSCRLHVIDDYTLTGETDHDRGVRDGLLVSLGAVGCHLSRMFPDHWNAGYNAISFEYHPDSMRHKGALHIIGRTDRRDTEPMCSVGLYVADQHPGSIADDIISSLLRRVLQWPAMSVASSFKTNHECLANPTLWITVLSCLPHVRQLYLEEDATLRAIASLSEALKHFPVIVPALASIHLNHMSFPPSTQRSLAEAAKARAVAGHGKIALAIERCLDVEVGPRALHDAIRNDSGGALYLDPPYYDISVTR